MSIRIKDYDPTDRNRKSYIIIDKWAISKNSNGSNRLLATKPQITFRYNCDLVVTNVYKTNEEFIEILIRDITASKGTDPITESQGFIDAILQDNNLQTFLEHIEFLTEADIQYMILKIG